MAFLRAFGSYVPERVVSNEELAPLLGVEPEWIVAQSGIRERRYAAEGETVISLGHRAALDCLANANVAAADLGLILVASGSTDRYCPGPATAIAALLGLTTTPAIDLPIASAGTLAALVLAARLAPSTGNILIIGAEIMSRRVELSPEGRNVGILFGDGAGAALVSRDTGFARIADTCLHTDGNSAEALSIANSRIHMEGLIVIKHASKRMPEAILELLERNHIAATDIGTFLIHQANRVLLERIAKVIAAPVDRFFVNIDRYGNTSSASMLIAADEWRQSAPGPLAAPIMFVAFGVGFTWGAALALPLEA
jgi:3-oxoacyl-[acyl-carrier-protein] synthase-3